jgi:hypothetical protein
MTAPKSVQDYLDRFGRQLVAAKPAQTRAARPKFAFAIAIPIAIATAIVVAGFGVTGARLDPIAEARAALAPSGEILHMRIAIETTDPSVANGERQETMEIWSAQNPPRWRVARVIPARSGLGESGVSSRHELAYADGVQTLLISPQNLLQVTRGLEHDESAVVPPSPFGAARGDVRADLHSLLGEGRVTDEGEIDVDGRRVHRFTGQMEAESVSREFVYDVDPRTFEPLAGTLTIRSAGRSEGESFVRTTNMRVELFDRLPVTPANQRSLTVEVPAQAKGAEREVE